MSKSLKSYWVNRTTLSEVDRKRLVFFIGEELRYYNTLVGAFAGPIRSMPETFVQTAAFEGLLAILAERAEEPGKLKANHLHPVYEPYRAELFDERNRLRLSDRMQFIANTLATPATLAPAVRRNMAMTVLAEFRRQSRALNESHDGGMPTIIETLMPIERDGKRHVQLPRSAVKVREGKDEVVLKLPYFGDEFTLPKPNASWNYVYPRFDHDGSVSIDLAFEDADYVMRKVDRPAHRGKPKGQPHLSRQGARYE